MCSWVEELTFSAPFELLWPYAGRPWGEQALNQFRLWSCSRLRFALTCYGSRQRLPTPGVVAWWLSATMRAFESPCAMLFRV
jgi:hypothetical protein